LNPESLHKAYVQELIAKGHKARTGYWSQRGGGMMLFEAESLDQARAIVALDPLVQNDCVNYNVYLIRREGSRHNL
jgi:uncharacterized protein YciI